MCWSPITHGILHGNEERENEKIIMYDMADHLIMSIYILRRKHRNIEHAPREETLVY